MYLVISLPYN